MTSSVEEIPPVDCDELLARFVIRKEYIRSDGTVRLDAFIPHPYPDLSVTRHIGLDEDVIWGLGHSVAREITQKKDKQHRLHGRVDIQAKHPLSNGLSVVPDPLPENRNHANICGWPPGKPEQKVIAKIIAQQARFIPSRD